MNESPRTRRSHPSQPQSIVETKTDKIPGEEQNFYEVVNCTAVNIRKNPSRDAEIIGVLSAGTKVLVISKDISFRPFYKVDSEGVVGYIMTDFLRRD